MRPSTLTASLLAAGCCLYASLATAADAGSAAITRDTNGVTWHLAAGGAALTLRCGPNTDFAVLTLTSAGDTVTTGERSDATVTIGGHALAFGKAADGFVFDRAEVVDDAPRKRLDVTYTLADQGLRVTRHYAVVDGAPAFEAWTTLQALPGKSVKAADLNALALDVRPGRVWSVTGLQGDDTANDSESAFTLRNRTLAAGQAMTRGSTGRSSETTVPWIAIDEDGAEFFAALLWSGAWRMTAVRSDSALTVTFGLAPMATAIGAQAVDGPHVVFGAVRGGVSSVEPALRAYVMDGVRNGRPLAAPVIYNTWYAMGTELDADGVRDAMERAATLGVEVFVLDAGWYVGAGENGMWDFDTGLGVWEPDEDRFPGGLAALSDYAHGLGLKFGLWMEADRINLSMVGQPGLAQESWLATHGGDYGSGPPARICLSGPGRAWVVDQITHVVETARLDYLKWDNNLWVNCDRDGHGHGADDGNFADTAGYYAALATLRQRFPDLIIENCGGGGVRLDLGMLRYTDAGWVDDRTRPSAHVRHNLEGLSAVFPPAYLLSFIVESEDEPIHESNDLMLYFRSRMLGVLGLSFDLRGFPEGYWDAMTRTIGTARDTRGATGMQTGTILTPPANTADNPGWDVLQLCSDDRERVVIMAFQTDTGVDRFVVKPRWLVAGATYDVWSEDLGALSSATGAALSADGLELEASPDSASHMIVLTARKD